MKGDNISEINEVGFSVDSGLIHRLGTELVGKAETAVSELIKNAYDADATTVDVEFINSMELGGTLIISDNGVGMTKDQLINGFMRISSSDKIHNPVSDIFGRKKAGRKGIGRFATQRLGKELTIVTQATSKDEAYKITIDWTQYKVDTDLISIKFPIETLPKQKSIGTTLEIKYLTDIWDETSIKRIYNYVVDLLQPDFIKPKEEKDSINTHSSALVFNTQKDQKFNVTFKRTNDSVTTLIVGDKSDITNKALATIEGYIDHHGKGKIHINSKGLKITDSESIDVKYDIRILKAVRVKVYYFIYDKSHYYSNEQQVSKKDLSNINKIANNSPHIKLYRNGFRVLPYGEIGNDWLSLDKRYTGESGYTNIPWGNMNFFGFVQIIDTNGDLFEETASREGLIENQALENTIHFIQSILLFAKKRISAAVYKIREDEKIDTPFDEKIDGFRVKIDRQLDQLEKVVLETEKSIIRELRANIQENFIIFEQQSRDVLDEMNMMRILAGMGLTIGEFTHEIRNIASSITGILSPLYQIITDTETAKLLDELESSIKNLLKYAQYFERTISKSKKIDIEPINIIDVVNNFSSTVREDTKAQKITLDTQFLNYGLYTIPMHESEWNAILFNLYTNSKKALRGILNPKIKILIGKDQDIIYIEFMDNGIGIPEENENRIFDAFFTTSTSSTNEIEGSGLGLKIIKDIITSYNGRIFLTDPTVGYVTSFRIEINISKT